MTPPAAGVPGSVRIQVGTPNRAKFNDIIAAATVRFGAGSEQVRILTEFMQWVATKGTPKVRALMNSLSPDGRQVYAEVFNAVVTEKCNGCVDPKRAKFEEIITKTIDRLGAGHADAIRLQTFLDWIQTKATPEVRAAMNTLGRDNMPIFADAYNGIVAINCGCQSVNMPSISGAAPNVIRAGTTNVEITITGANLPTENVGVGIFLGATTEDDNIEIVSGRPVDANTYVLTISVKEAATVGERTLLMTSLDHLQLRASTTLDITEPAVTTSISGTSNLTGLKPGDTLPTGFAIYGSGLDRVARIVSRDGAIVFDDNRLEGGDIIAADACSSAAPGTPNLEMTSCTDQFILTKALTVREDIAPGTYTFDLQAADDTVLATFNVEIVGPEAESRVVGYGQPWWRREDYTHVQANLEVGHNFPVGGELHPLARAAGDRVPTYRLQASARLPIVAKPGEFGIRGLNTEHAQVELRGDAAFEQHVNIDEDDTLRLEISPELRATFPTVPFVTPDLRLRYSYRYNDEAFPNRHFYSGHTNSLSPELGVQLDRLWEGKVPWLSARLFGSYQADWVNWNTETGYGDFRGRHDTGRAGAEVELRLAEVYTDKPAVPNLKISSYGLWGEHAVPERFQGALFDPAFESVSGGGFDIEAQWPLTMPLVQITNPSLRLRYDARKLESWDRTTRWEIAAGSDDIARAGSFNLNYVHDEFEPFYRSQQDGIHLNWRPPVHWSFRKDGWLPARAFSLTAGYDQYRHGDIFGQEGKRHDLRVVFGFDPLEFFFPGEPVEAP